MYVYQGVFLDAKELYKEANLFDDYEGMAEELDEAFAIPDKKSRAYRPESA